LSGQLAALVEAELELLPAEDAGVEFAVAVDGPDAGSY
jgi:hypothetical protein